MQQRKMWWRFTAVVTAAAIVAALIDRPVDVATALDGKRIVLTGASEGIGRDVALQLAAAGARVVVCARNKTKLDAVSAEAAGGRVVAVQADLSTAEGVMRFWAEATGELGGVDILILNHVAGYFDDVLTSAPGFHIYPLLERLLRVNTLAYAQLAMIALAQNGLGQETVAAPAIVVVSSAAGKVGLPRVAPYAASKHALHGFFDSLRHDLVHRGSNATVTMVVLGNIDTDSNRDATVGKISSAIKRYPVADAAAVVVRAAVTRCREVYYPWLEIAPLVTLHSLFPSTVDAAVRFLVEP